MGGWFGTWSLVGLAVVFPFKECYILAVDAFGAVYIVGGNRAVDEEVLTDDVQKTSGSGAAQFAIEQSGGIRGVDLAFGEDLFVIRHGLEIRVTNDCVVSVSCSASVGCFPSVVSYR
jgi:hypothetical protein